MLALIVAPQRARERAAPTQAELEGELICPACRTTLDQSNAAVALRMKQFVRTRIAAGGTKSEIKDRLVAQFVKGVLAAPSNREFDLLAWVLPIARLLAGAGVLTCSRGGGRGAPRTSSPSSSDRPDRGGVSRGARLGRGPCVLPLVPGFCRSWREARRPRVASSRERSFVLGFTVVFVLLGAGAAALGSVLAPERPDRARRTLLIVFGLAFAGLLPWPERCSRLVSSCARDGSTALLVAAFAVCAAPALGRFSARCSCSRCDRDRCGGSYSDGVLARARGRVPARRRCFRARDDRLSRAARQLGDDPHRQRFVLVALGLLLFFHREWWLYVGLRRVLDTFGLGDFLL